jgi:ATP-binding cassette subfamily B protein
LNTFKKLIPFIRPYLWCFAIVILSTILVTSSSLAGPWIIRSLVELIQSKELAQVKRIYVLAGLFLLVNTIRAISFFFTSYLSHLAAWRMVRDLRVKLYEHLQKLSLRYYGHSQTGELMSRVTYDTANLEPLLAHGIPDVAVNCLMLIGIAAILFWLNPILATYTLIPIPFLILAVTSFSKRVRPAFKSSQEELANLNAVLQDNISGIKEIQSFTRETEEAKKVSKQADSYTHHLLRALKLNAIYHPSIEWLASAGNIIIVLFGGIKALQSELPVEDLVAFLLYLNMFYQPITVLARLNEGIQQALASNERIFELLETEPEVQSPKKAIIPKNIKGRIDFRNVSFQYVSEAPVLNDISFIIEPGKTLALVGPTGVGKSTIAALVPRFYDVTKGSVLIDGYNVKDLDLKTLRMNISMVLQDVFLFNGTVRDNVLYGNPNASEEELRRACKLAHAEEFILELPEGYHTHIGERGMKLSGGQKQRLSIARAILKDAPILILDEATSSVDNRTEMEIQKALEELMKDRTTIVIAHRLSTIRNADKIAILDDGKIIGIGSHKELLEGVPMYRSLYELDLSTRSI